MEHEGGFLVYKCRRCGGEVRNTHVPDGVTVLYYLLFGYDIPSHWWRTPLPHKESIHHCKDGSLGVADLIGVEIDK